MLTQSSLSRRLIETLAATLDPSEYIAGIGVEPFEWQHEALDPGCKRLILMCARQSGKSTVVAGKVTNKAKYVRDGLNIITSPTEKQSKETMLKVDEYIRKDPELLNSLKKDSTFEKEFNNGSRIIALPGTETSVRGYSAPMTIVMDEASRMLDPTYKALRPMMTGNTDGELILLSTPFGKRGFFYKEWTKNPIWKKILVKPRWDLVNDETWEELMPEDVFRKFWATKGVSAYYSPRHSVEWLYEELISLGPIDCRREYNCEFIEDEENMFAMSLIESAYNTDIKTYYTEEDDYSDQVKVADFLNDLFAPKQYAGVDL